MSSPANDLDEVLNRIWADDLLRRREDAEFLQEYLCGVVEQRAHLNRQASYVLNIDAVWGAGKSFFLERLAQQLRANGYLVAEVDAWATDHTDDPFVAVLSAIDEALDPYTAKPGKLATSWGAVKKGAVPLLTRVASSMVKTVIKKRTGESFENWAEYLSESVDDDALADALSKGSEQVTVEIEKLIDEGSEKIIEKFTAQTKAVENFRERLSAATSTLGQVRELPLFVLVDELDRCRPSYAVALLERVKHLFEVSGVVFVFATNSQQLQFSIQGAYGPGFDGYKYLRRFFERTYLLTEPSKLAFIQTQLLALDGSRIRAPKDDAAGFLDAAAASYKMDLREIEQLMDLLASILAVWPRSLRLELVSFVALAVLFLRTGECTWNLAQQQIPDSFKLQMGYRHTDYRSAPDPVTLSVQGAFSIVRSNRNSMEGMMGLLNNGDGAEKRYVYDTFSPEWNGKSINRGAPTSIADLHLRLVQAGRLKKVADGTE